MQGHAYLLDPDADANITRYPEIESGALARGWPRLNWAIWLVEQNNLETAGIADRVNHFEGIVAEISAATVVAGVDTPVAVYLGQTEGMIA